MLLFDVVFKCDGFVVKIRALQTWKAYKEKYFKIGVVASGQLNLEDELLIRKYMHFGIETMKQVYSPHMKHVFFKVSSLFCFSDLKSAKVSMITPKMRLSTMMMITK